MKYISPLKIGAFSLPLVFTVQGNVLTYGTVPLSRQAIEILKELQPLTATRGKYVFPLHRSATRPMSENTVNAALRRMDDYLDGLKAGAQVIPFSKRVNE